LPERTSHTADAFDASTATHASCDHGALWQEHALHTDDQEDGQHDLERGPQGERDRLGQIERARTARARPAGRETAA
jgi:hypothetical protein